MVSSRLRRESGPAVRCDPFPKSVLLPYKLPRLRLLVRKLCSSNIRHGRMLAHGLEKCQRPLSLERRRERPQHGPEVAGEPGNDSDSAVWQKRVLSKSFHVRT